MKSKYYDTSSARYKDALAKYQQLGRQLYGMELAAGGRELTPEQRREAKMLRRAAENVFPRLRELEMDEPEYRDRPTTSKPAPRIFVEIAPDGRTGRIVYPDGSRSQYAVVPFSSPEEMMQSIAELIYYGKVDVSLTTVMVGGSAQPLLTFVSGQG